MSCPSARRSAPARTSGADEADGGSVGSLGWGVGLAGGGSGGSLGWFGAGGGSAGDAPPRVGEGFGGWGRCPPPVGFAAAGADPLGSGEASAPSLPCAPSVSLPSDPAFPPRACRPPAACPPSDSATDPRLSTDELGAGFPPSSSLTLIQPAEAATASEAAIQTAKRPGTDQRTDNWRTSGTSGAWGVGFPAQLPAPHKGHAPAGPGPPPAPAYAPYAISPRAKSAPRNTAPSPTSSDAATFAAARNFQPRSASRSVS
jgi:hypothetical protein